MQRPKTKPYRSKKYLEYIRSEYCFTCGDPNTIPHHENQGFKPSGTSSKTDDTKCLPLCVECHNERHAIGVESFFGEKTAHYVHRYIRKYIEDNHNVDPDCLVVELLTEWLKEND